MAAKKKTTAKQAEAEKEPGFFSDYGYGEGSLILHDPPQRPRDTKPGKVARPSKNKKK